MNYREALIPKERRQRPEYPLTPKKLTMHNTANPDADADAHQRWLAGVDTKASAHIFVDDREAVLCIPLNEQAWHAGTTPGNTTSIGIEVCEFTDRARQDAADRNAQLLVAQMLTGIAPPAFRATGLRLSDVVSHQSWMQYGTSGKYCPRMILPWWESFIAGIAALMAGAPVPAPHLDPVQPTKPVLHLGDRGAQVRTLQAALNTHHAHLAVDGIFGPATLAAVRGFQHTKGLVVDGIVGERTWAALALPAVTPTPAPVQHPATLRRGARGELVRQLQAALRERHYSLALDGIFGPATEGAVKRWQASQGLSADGIVGPLTWASLGR